MDPYFREMGTEKELAIILSHYESNFIYDVVKDQISNALYDSTNFISQIPNVVGAWEQNFKAIIDTYGAEGLDQIQTVRQETYREIIDIICNSYELNFSIDENIDLYTAAYVLYDFFICNISNNISRFYARFIYNERANLYDSMNLKEIKNNRDTSTIYGRKLYKDFKLAIVNANLYKVLINVIDSMDFSFDTFIIGSCMSRQISDYILTLVSDKGSFYANIPLAVIKRRTADYLTDIRFKIQELAELEGQISYNTAEEAANAKEVNDIDE